MCAVDAAAVAGLDAAGVRAVGAALRLVRGLVERVDALVTARAESIGRAGGPVDGRLFQREHGDRSDRGARRAVARAQVLEDVPALAAAVADGGIGVAHADAVARAVGQLDAAVRADVLGSGAWLAAEARRSSPEQLERAVRREAARLGEPETAAARLARQREESSVSRWVEPEGLHHLHATLDPERGARVFAVLDAAVERAFRRAHPGSVQRAPTGGVGQQRLAASALVEALTGIGSGSGGGGGPAGSELVVLVDEASLRAGIEQLGGICETASGVPLPVATARKLLCEAEVFPVVLGADGHVLDHGRGRRLASREQRRALRAMHRTCVWPGCTVTFDRCHVHHLTEYRHGGRTDLAELVPVCSEHHHLVHDLGWRLVLDGRRNVTLHAPDGSVAEVARFEPLVPPPELAGPAPGRARGSCRSSQPALA